ncbi:MAG TPA: SRPBCC family protein [Solirubrobacteraceae bacterium]|nr:SRPBCC family protein [Solirubrobacteraceae bacterium]
MSRVTASIDIAAPPERIWEVVMDPDRLGDWVSIHRDVEKVSDRPLRDGSTLEQKLCLRGVNFHVRWKVAQARPGEEVVWDGRGPARSKAHTAYRLAPNGDGGTTFHYENEFKAPLGPLGAVASRALVGGLPEREARATLANLKRVVEADAG